MTFAYSRFCLGRHSIRTPGSAPTHALMDMCVKGLAVVTLAFAYLDNRASTR